MCIWKTTREHLQSSSWRHTCCMRIPCESHWSTGCSDDTWRGPSCRNGLLCSLWICIFGCRWPMFGCQFLPALHSFGTGRRDSDQKCGKRFTFSPFHARQCFLHFDLGAVHAGGSHVEWKVLRLFSRFSSLPLLSAGYCVCFLLYTLLLYVSIPACDELQVNIDSNYQPAMQLWSVDCVEC